MASACSKDSRACSSLELSLAISRSIGDRRAEAFALDDLGSVPHCHLTDEAERSYERALDLHRRVGACHLEGAALSGLARLHARQGRRAEARQAFAAAERLLREADDRIELGKLLAARGEADLAAGDRPGAAAALAEAAALAGSTGAGPESPLARAVAALRRALADG